MKKEPGQKYLDMLNARAKQNDAKSAAKRADNRPIREKAADRKADLEYGYPKVGVRFGTVDPGNPGLREARNGARVDKSPVGGASAGTPRGVVFNAIERATRRKK